MEWGKRRPVSPTGRRRGTFHPASEYLEDRCLLSGTVDLANTETAPYGVEMLGTANTNAGATVTDVGDVTKTVGGGYDAYVISNAVTTPSAGANNPSLDPLTTSFTGNTAYLVVGSDSVGTSTAVPYNGLSNVPLTQANQRAGDLGQLGQLGELNNPAYQINPTVTQPAAPTQPFAGYNYNGLTFTTSDTASGLGFSVAALGDIDGSGYQSFAIGAPGEGKVYVIYGSASLATLVNANTATNKTFNLDLTTGTGSLAGAGVKELILTGTGDFGYSVAGIGNYFNYGLNVPFDIAIGQPSSNAVYALSGEKLQTLASGTTTNIAPGTTLGIAYGGPSGSDTGASVSYAGDFDGYHANNSSSSPVDDLLIGAPGLFGNKAYLVYGYQQYANQNGVSDSTLGTTQDLTQITAPLPTNSTLNYPLEGLVFNDASAVSAHQGFSVASAGDYNGDGIADVVIGAPAGQGSATIFYGVPTFTPATSAVPKSIHIVGVYTPSASSVTTAPIVPPPLVYQGDSGTSNDFGYSLSYVGDISGEGINGILVGAPLANLNSGLAYAIPGNYETPVPAGSTVPGLASPENIGDAITNQTYAATAFQVTNSDGTPAYLGISVSGRTPLIPNSGVNAQQYSIDQDSIPDIFIGAPGFSSVNPANSGTVGRAQAGIAFALEGSLLPLSIPNNVILSPAGIGTNSSTGPYTITPKGALTIYLFSNTTSPSFDPLTDLLPASPVTLTVNGVTFTSVTITSAASATDPGEVKFSLTTAQVAQLNLVASTTPISFTIRGTTVAKTVFVARAINDVTVSNGGGGGGGGGGGVSSSAPTAASILAAPIFTGELAGQEFPSITTLNTLSSYQPIPVQLAYQQFLPAPGFNARLEVAAHPSKKGGAHQYAAGTQLVVPQIRGSESPYLRHNFLSQTVRDRGKIPIGKTVKFTHKVKVVPTTAQTATFVG